MDPVLIVDDEKDNLEALQRLLRNQYAVTTTNSPFEALKLIQKSEFNVIISDQRMPEMTGVELLEKIKNVRPATTRVLLTGYTDIESVIGAINRGNIYRYVAKPWDPEDLKITLRQANEAFHLRRELERKNEALTKANLELRQALADLELLDRAKARFLSLISHELNTPLTVLTSFVGLLTEKKNSFSKDIQKSVSSIESASGRFSEIVSEVLTYVRLESENRLHLVPFDFAEETLQLKKILAPALELKKLTMTIEAKFGVVANCDAEKMKLALRKLLEDAIARSPNEESVMVSMLRANGEVHYSVQRKGEAVSEEAFKPLETAAAQMHHQKNLGLGLAICKLIVESHGGDLNLRSSAEEGTLVSLVIPHAVPIAK